jgi:hypothetical protein
MIDWSWPIIEQLKFKGNIDSRYLNIIGKELIG